MPTPAPPPGFEMDPYTPPPLGFEEVSDEPWRDSAWDVEGSPEAQAATGANMKAAVHAVGAGAAYVGDKLQAVRRHTVDPIARAASRLAGVATPDVVGPDGKPRAVTAPELLEQGIFPQREPGGRPTSKDVVAGGIHLSGLDRVPGMPGAEELVAKMPDLVVKLLGGAPGALGDLDAAVAAGEISPRLAKVGEDLTRVGVRTAAGLVTDPLSAGGVTSAAGALGAGTRVLSAASRADQALTATGAVLGAAGAVEHAAKAHEHFVQGNIDAMLVDLAEMTTSGAMGYVAKKGLSEITAAKNARRAAVDTGDVYAADPRLMGDAKVAAEARAAAQHQAEVGAAVEPVRSAVADVRAMDPLDAAGLTKGEPTPGRVGAATVEGPFEIERTESTRPSAVNRPLTSVRVEDTPIPRARTADGLVERQGPVEQKTVRDEAAPDVRMSPRAMAVAAELGASAEPIPTEAVGGERLPQGQARVRTQLQERLAERIAARKDAAARAVANQATAARQRAEVAESAVGVGPAHDSARRIGERAITTDDAYAHLSRLPKVGEELAGRHAAAEEAKETIAGRLKAPARDVLAELGPNEKTQATAFESEVAPALDGKAPVESLSPAARRVYDVYRAEMDRGLAEHNIAREEAGLEPLQREKDYFPRVGKGESLLEIEDQAAALASQKSIPIEDAMRQLRGNDAIIASRTDRKGSFEQTRTGDMKDVRHDPGVVMDYFDVLARRTAELTHYGKNGEKLSALIAQLPDAPRLIGEGVRTRLGLPNSKYKIGDRAFAQLFFDRSRNVVPTGLGTQVGHIVRTLSGLHDLVWSAPRQLESIAQTALAAGVRGTAKGVWQTVAGEVSRADLAHPRQLAHAVARSIRQAGVSAERVAAVSHHVTADLMNSAMTAGAKPPFWIRAMLAADRGQRYAAVRTWEAVGPDLISKAKGGVAAEQRNLDRMGIDWKNIDPADASAMDLAAKRFSDATQYRSGIGTLPPWASSPGGRMAFQYLSFINAHTKTVKYVASEAAKGNPKPAARFIAVGLPIALMNNTAISMLKGYKFNDDEIKPGQTAKALADELAGRRHTNPFAGGREAAVVLARGLSALGVGMVYQAMLERGGSGKVTDLLPAGKYIEGVEGIVGGKDEESRARSTAKLAASLIPALPGTDVIREVAAGKKSTHPGWGGRARDFLEDAGLRTGGGSAERQALIDAEKVAQRRTSANTELKDIAAPRPAKPAAKAMTDAEKTARKAELTVDMAKALRDKDPIARLKTLIEARRIRRPFTRKDIASLSSRVYYPEVEGDDTEEIQ